MATSELGHLGRVSDRLLRNCRECFQLIDPNMLIHYGSEEQYPPKTTRLIIVFLGLVEGASTGIATVRIASPACQDGRFRNQP